MIKIFNKKLNSEILIDEKASWIQFTPRIYDDIPYIIIEMKEFNLITHSTNCKDCKNFLNSFGNDSLDWYLNISESNKIYRLNTKEIGNKKYPSNEIKTIDLSDYESGTKLTLLIHKIPTDKKELIILLNSAVEDENYEEACKIRDLINEIDTILM